MHRNDSTQRELIARTSKEYIEARDHALKMMFYVNGLEENDGMKNVQRTFIASWDWGRACTGHEETRKHVQSALAQQMPAVLHEAVEAAKAQAEEKLSALTALCVGLHMAFQ